MIPVRSRVIAAVGYNPAILELRVRLRVWYVYAYSRVPQAVYDAFMAAPSKGTYYNRKIRGHYPAQRLS